MITLVYHRNDALEHISSTHVWYCCFKVWRVSWNVTGTILAASFDAWLCQTTKEVNQVIVLEVQICTIFIITVNEAREYLTPLELNLTSGNVKVSLQHGD